MLEWTKSLANLQHIYFQNKSYCDVINLCWSQLIDDFSMIIPHNQYRTSHQNFRPFSVMKVRECSQTGFTIFQCNVQLQYARDAKRCHVLVKRVILFLQRSTKCHNPIYKHSFNAIQRQTHVCHVTVMLCNGNCDCGFDP